MNLGIKILIGLAIVIIVGLVIAAMVRNAQKTRNVHLAEAKGMSCGGCFDGKIFCQNDTMSTEVPCGIFPKLLKG